MVDMKKTNTTSMWQLQKLLDSTQVHLHLNDLTSQWHLLFKTMRSCRENIIQETASLWIN